MTLKCSTIPVCPCPSSTKMGLVPLFCACVALHRSMLSSPFPPSACLCACLLCLYNFFELYHILQTVNNTFLNGWMKGTGSRPHSHLYEATEEYHRGDKTSKVGHVRPSVCLLISSYTFLLWYCELVDQLISASVKSVINDIVKACQNTLLY